jgi:uncharacterized membrane protein YjgN (DUF898 family)
MSLPPVNRGFVPRDEAPHVPVADAGIRPDSEERRYPVEFTAATGEYFRIWIVNLALTVATLGIYSAWAKVRKRRYFYSHTRIDGEGFEYLANPIAILKGRLIAFALFGVFYAVGHFAPLYQWILWIPLAIAAPWLIVRSLAFNAYNTAYRNLRLRFHGTYKSCLKLVVGYGLLAIVTLFFAFPFMKRRLTQFVAENHAYGVTRFELGEGFRRPFVNAYFAAWGLSILGLFGIGIVVFGASYLSASRGDVQSTARLFGFAAVFLTYGMMFLLYGYIRARTINAVFNNLRIGPVRFECVLSARKLIWLYVSNIVVILLSLGFATPWAVVRTMRYRASRLTAIGAGPLDSFVQGESQQVSATGEEVGEMFAIDFGL